MNEQFMARFRPQVWRNDYAENEGEVVEFDATAQLLSLPLERIRDFQEHNYDSDDLADGLPERQNHSGPFEVDTDLDGWLEQNGIEDRQTMTQADLDRLKEKYGVGL